MYASLLKLVIPYNWHYAILSTALAVFSVTFAALVACYRELSAQPAVLMRPVAPKPGKRVFIRTDWFYLETFVLLTKKYI